MTDATTRNEDWLRTRTWDLYDTDHKLVTTLSQLQRIVGTDRDAVAHFLTLPAAEAMPKDLHSAAAEYAAGHDPIPHAVEQHQDVHPDSVTPKPE